MKLFSKLSRIYMLSLGLLLSLFDLVENLSEIIRSVIGGLHLVTAGINRLNQTVAALNKSHVQRVIPLHCTGDMAIDFLSDGLGNKITPGMAGQTYGF